MASSSPHQRLGGSLAFPSAARAPQKDPILSLTFRRSSPTIPPELEASPAVSSAGPLTPEELGTIPFTGSLGVRLPGVRHRHRQSGRPLSGAFGRIRKEV